MRDARGQGTVEWVGIVLLVALLLAAAVALASGAGIGERVAAALRRALCVVTGGACTPAERAAALPCVVASDSRSERGAFTVALVRIGEGSAVLRELRSDGTVALTLVSSEDLGLSLGAPEAHLRWGSFDVAVGRELRAAVLAQRSGGRTWIARDAAEAERLLPRIRLAATSFGRRAGVSAPDPDVEYREGGTGASLAGRGLELATAAVYGERVDHATGRRTVYLRDQQAGALALSLGEDVTASGELTGEERVAVTYDRRGRPLDLMVLATLDVAGAVALPPTLARAAGALGIPREGRRHVEAERHLDLTDPANADLAGAFLAGLGEGGPVLRLAADALRERLDATGTLAVRSYDVAGEERSVGGTARLVGLEYGEEEQRARLTGALRRAPGGVLLADEACRPA